jgi:hypothetical protein
MGNDIPKRYQIDALIDCDKENVEKTKQALLGIHKDSLGATEECFQLFERIGVLFGNACDYDQYSQQLNKWLKTRRGTAEQNVRFLEEATLIGQVPGADPVADAKEAVERANSVIARSYLLLRLGRDFFFGLSDLLRLRLTSMHGYVRIQAETAAILALCGAEPDVAVDWLNMATTEEGKRFYNKYHTRITANLRDLGLYHYFDNGSNMSLHSRVLGVASGIIAGKKTAARGEVRLVYQEADDAVVIFLWLCVYLKAHNDILTTLPKALPEVDFGQVDLARYGTVVDSLWGTLWPLYLRKTSEGLPRLLDEFRR